jgi:hypothetical protein
MCKSWCEAILGLIIILFAVWPNSFSKWVFIIAGLVLIWHSFMCNKCKMISMSDSKMSKKKR